MKRMKLFSRLVVLVGLAAWFTGIFAVPSPHNVGLIMLANLITGTGVGLLLKDPLSRLISETNNSSTAG